MRSSWIYINLLLALIGVIFIWVLITTLFVPGQQSNAGMDMIYSPSADSPQFIGSLARLLNVPVEHGQAVTPITDGKQFLPILTSAINSASSTIDFTTYPWSEGTMSDQVLVALASAEKRGVSVRVLIDALGGHTISDSDLSALRAAGAEVVRYHPFSIWNPLQYNERDHMRSIVIDGKTGFVGGMGIGDDWLGDGVISGWNDLMFRVSGSMTASLQGNFAQLWKSTTGEVLAGPQFYPPVANSPASSGSASSTGNTYINVASIPSENLEPIRDTFLYSIMNAQKSIYIISPFIIPDPDIVSTLENKARSGVDVEIISPGAKTNAPFMRSAWQSNYTDLLAAGVKIYEYAPEMIHTKIMVVDGVWSVIGSANLDSRSELLNDENILGIQDAAFANQLQDIFRNDLTLSNQITEAQWKSTGFLTKWWDYFITLFAKQF